MSSDTNVTNFFAYPPVGSFLCTPTWMTIVPQFPRYQPISFEDEAMQEAWDRAQTQYPVVNDIAVGSSAIFVHYFVNCVAEFAKRTPTYNLCELLDEAFNHVSRKTQKDKHFMEKQDASEPAKKKRKVDEVATSYMNLHFANLMEDQFTDVVLSCAKLRDNHGLWTPKCRFPIIEEDLLLYLAMLGGKTYSGYYDHVNEAHSTLRIFSTYLHESGFHSGGNTNDSNNNYKTFENMVAHMIFSASRRNGVQGIFFDNFFAGLLGEFQDKFRPMRMTMESSDRPIVANNLFNGYADVANLVDSKIPFLAPPNARWPKCIRDGGGGCNLGHLVYNKDGHDIYVENRESSDVPLFVCECKYWDGNSDWYDERGR